MQAVRSHSDRAKQSSPAATLEQHMYMRVGQQHAAALLVPWPRATEPLRRHQPPQRARPRPPFPLCDSAITAEPLRTCAPIAATRDRVQGRHKACCVRVCVTFLASIHLECTDFVCSRPTSNPLDPVRLILASPAKHHRPTWSESLAAACAGISLVRCRC